MLLIEHNILWLTHACRIAGFCLPLFTKRWIVAEPELQGSFKVISQYGILLIPIQL